MVPVRKNWPLAAIAMIVFLVLIYLAGGKRETDQESAPDKDPSEEGLKLGNIRYTQNDPGEKVKWNLEAKEVRFSQERQLFLFRDFFLMLEPEGRPGVEVRGRNGDYDKNAGRMNLYGNLEGQTENGYTIRTEHILYDRGEGCLKTEDPVTITGPAVSVSGKGLFFDIELGTLTILSRVKTSVYDRFFGL